MQRREFFKASWNETIRAAQKSFLGLQETVSSVSGAVEQVLNDDDTPGNGKFFDSYEMSYSLTLAYPREMFEQMALEQNIPFEGVETIDIARELNLRGVI